MPSINPDTPESADPGGDVLKQIMTSDGIAVFHEDQGSGRPLVMLHGLMAHRGFFMRQRKLASDFRLILVDLRGHGRSKAEPAFCTMEALAADIATLSQELDLRDAIGLGWSLGASVLWQVLAGPAGSRFAGAVVVDMSPRVLNGPDWQLGLSPELCDARTAAMRNDFQAFAHNAGHAIFAQPVQDPVLADWAGGEFARNDPAAIEALWTSLVQEDYRTLLPRIAQPTLIIHGKHSQLYGAGTAEYLAAAMPAARAIQFERSGHAPQLEQPDDFNRTLRTFAASLPRVREHQATA